MTELQDAPAQADALDFFIDYEPPASDFRADALAGLAQPQKTIPPKYFYDERGSQLFEDICEASEYYVTNAELEVLEARADAIARRAGPRAAVIELGAGAAVKIRTLLDHLEDPALYLPIDISGDHLIAAANDLASDHPDLRVGAVHADFTQELHLPETLYADSEKRIVFFPGSTIGNFEPNAALQLLKTARGLIRPGDLLVIGVDLKKDRAILEAAYDDAGGVTAAFNKNLLNRINAELDGDIGVDAFRHCARWNAEKGRVEMHLVAKRDLAFTVAGRRFTMEAGETIHTENSHKFTVDEFAAIARQAGFAQRDAWTDAAERFSVQVFEAA